MLRGCYPTSAASSEGVQMHLFKLINSFCSFQVGVDESLSGSVVATDISSSRGKSGVRFWVGFLMFLVVAGVSQCSLQ